MTRLRAEEILCMNCNRRQQVTLYDSINVTLDPELKERLFQGEINLFQCESCGEKVFLPVPLLYHDMINPFMVMYFPFEFLEDKDFLNQFSKDGQWGIEFKEVVPRKLRKLLQNVHIVFDMGELIRYVVFRDKLAELWKDPS